MMLSCECLRCETTDEWWQTRRETEQWYSKGQRSAAVWKRLVSLLKDVSEQGGSFFLCSLTVNLFRWWRSSTADRSSDFSICLCQERFQSHKRCDGLSPEKIWLFLESQCKQSPVPWRNSRRPWSWVLLAMPWVTGRVVGKAAPQARRSKRNWPLWGDWGARN